MDPQPVARLKIGYFGNGTRCPAAFHADINLRPDQVEGGVFSQRQAGNSDQRKKGAGNQEAAFGIRITEQRLDSRYLDWNS